MNEAVIVAGARTPMGAFQGSLALLSAPKLGAAAIAEAIKRASAPADSIDEVLFGCVLQGGVGQAPARQAALAAGLPNSTPCTTINKVCGSGMKAIMQAAQAIKAGDAQLIVAGGMESMSNAPYALDKARTGYRMGNGTLLDLMIHDGLWDPYNNCHMGNCGDATAAEFNITREALDAFAAESVRRALEAQHAGRLAEEIVPVQVPSRKGDPVTVTEDEGPGKADPARLSSLRAAFGKEGVTTAGNASSINDGAAAVIVASAEWVRSAGVKPLARIIGYSQHAQEPERFTTAPAAAIEKLLKMHQLTVADIDLFEVNEAFAVVAMVVAEKVKIPHSKLNVNGGAVALGHPIGMTGARLVISAALELRRSGRPVCGLLTVHWRWRGHRDSHRINLNHRRTYDRSPTLLAGPHTCLGLWFRPREPNPHGIVSLPVVGANARGGEVMRVLFVAVEVAPYAKVGGLADVVGSLPKALRALGHDVRVVMPDYGMIDHGGHGPIKSVLKDVPVRVNSDLETKANIREIYHDGVPVYLISGGGHFRSVDRSEAIYTPGLEQYLFFSVAALKMLDPLGWTPDVIHCHDWHTGFVPVLMRERFSAEFAETASVFTIHNLAYQGEFDLDVLDKLSLSRALFNPHQVEAWGRVNFLKSGAAFSNRVNTVSPTYAKEILSPSFGANLDGFMRNLDDRGRLSGILNGIDEDMFDPASDPALPAHFSSEDIAGKRLCKAALLKELGMEAIEGAPLLGVVSRMSSQKGMDLIAETARELFDIPVQIVILGAGEPMIVEALTRLSQEYPQHLRYIDGFNLPLGARIYGACDGFLMPSAFEPCGLGQMIARRYGALPLVRATGGLADTVTEGVDGFVFHQRSPDEFVATVKRLAAAYGKPQAWAKLVHHAMKIDASWRTSALEYLRMYVEAQADAQAALRQTA